MGAGFLWGRRNVLRLTVVMATQLCEEAKPLRCTPYGVIVLCVNFILVKLLSNGGLSIWSPGELGTRAKHVTGTPSQPL